MEVQDETHVQPHRSFTELYVPGPVGFFGAGLVARCSLCAAVHAYTCAGVSYRADANGDAAGHTDTRPTAHRSADSDPAAETHAGADLDANDHAGAHAAAFAAIGFLCFVGREHSPCGKWQRDLAG